jgi:hypothetical protein
MTFLLQVAYHPPIVSVSFRLSPRIPKNMRDSILATKDFVVNFDQRAVCRGGQCETPADVSEWDISGPVQEPSVSSRGDV